MKKLGPILYCGDPHGKFQHIVLHAQQLQASAVVLLGDMESSRPLHEELDAISELVYFIPGNHDTDSDKNWSNVWESKLADRNIHGRVVELPDGTRLAGLGGVFREKVWHPNTSEPVHHRRSSLVRATPRQDRWREGPPLRHWTSIFPDEFTTLANLRADVLITHEAPGYHPHGFAALDTLARAMQVKVLVHGHQHDRLNSSGAWAGQGFKTFGVGMRGISAIDRTGAAQVIETGEHDDERSAHRQGMLQPPSAEYDRT